MRFNNINILKRSFFVYLFFKDMIYLAYSKICFMFIFLCTPSSLYVYIYILCTTKGFVQTFRLDVD